MDVRSSARVLRCYDVLDMCSYSRVVLHLPLRRGRDGNDPLNHCLCNTLPLFTLPFFTLRCDLDLS